jgi:hypothetical protein
MAQTRATSRAIRLKLGYIVTLAGYEATAAEEMPREEEPRRARRRPPAPEPTRDFKRELMEAAGVPRNRYTLAHTDRVMKALGHKLYTELEDPAAMAEAAKALKAQFPDAAAARFVETVVPVTSAGEQFPVKLMAAADRFNAECTCEEYRFSEVGRRQGDPPRGWCKHVPIAWDQLHFAIAVKDRPDYDHALAEAWEGVDLVAAKKALDARRPAEGGGAVGGDAEEGEVVSEEDQERFETKAIE